MRELEREKEKQHYWAERERVRNETRARENGPVREDEVPVEEPRSVEEDGADAPVVAEDGGSRKRSDVRRSKASRRRRWLGRVIFLLLLSAALVAGLFAVYWPNGVDRALVEGNRLFAGSASDDSVETEQDAGPAVVEEPAVEEGAVGETEEAEESAIEDAAASEEPAEEKNIYSATMSESDTKPSLAALPERVYVPNVIDNSIDVIDPETFEIIDHFQVEQLPYHITPSWDMTQLLVNNEESSTFTVIDPETGRPSGTVPAPFPYNFYYTPDGETAVVVVERLQTLEFRDTESWELKGSVYIPWPGVDHMDFSEDGSYLLASSEWSGAVSKVDVEKMELVDYVEVGALPIDIKLAPDGEHFYVADQGTMGVHVIEPEEMEEVEFIPTGGGAHGLQISRDTKEMYVSNRIDGTVSVIDLETNEVTDTWVTGGSPDMFQLSPDGRQLWVSGRYDSAVYVLDTKTGELLSTIYTGTQPHGLVYFPNPGRFSLGHNGVYR